jgi:hypothetical protein
MTYALRLVPLVFRIASLFLMLAVAWQCLRTEAVPTALALFAVSDQLVSYASELKQYSGDVACALAGTLLALTVRSKPVTVARLVALGTFGAAAVWFSHPAVFVLTGVGVILLAGGRARRDGWASAALVHVGLTWLSSFAAVYAMSRVQLGDPRPMLVFWHCAFPSGLPGRPEIPPGRSAGSCTCSSTL